MKDDRDDRLQLAHAGLHPERVRSLLAEWGSARAVVRAIGNGQVKTSDSARSAVAVQARRREADLARLGLAAVMRGDGAYPGHLADLPDAPDVLFLRGRLPEAPGVAVVGTRRCSGYGRGLARAFGRAIADAGWLLVSGLARGIDGEAHRGTRDAGGRGVAVLGSGIDVWYPPEHRDLGQGLVDLGGGVVSEYPPGTVPEPWRFPPRNRIISGLAAAVVVVEAGVKGGALITARTAVEQGREVLAVPGDVDRDASVGCNLLIRDGAIPVLGPDDLVEALSLLPGLPAPKATTQAEPADEIVALLGPVGRDLEWLARELGVTATEVMVRVAALEAGGRVCRAGTLVTRA